MRKVNRSLIAVPEVLEKPETTKEYKAAKKYHEARKKSGKKPGFELYKNESVRQALERLFHRKCAYCEARYAATQVMDVEHFRPKGAVEKAVLASGKGQHPGYWWLAMEWSNLLPSCVDCNRARYHVFENGKRIKVGKKDQFPLRAGSFHGVEPGDEDGEECLLLNPCKDDPEEHLVFMAKEFEQRLEAKEPARQGYLFPKERSEMGEQSILVYGLNRPGLVIDRRELLGILFNRMITIQGLVRLLAREMARDEPDEEQVAEIEDLLVHEMSALEEFIQPNRPYSVMARHHVERFLESLTESRSVLPDPANVVRPPLLLEPDERTVDAGVLP